MQALSVPLIGAIHQRSGTYRSRLAAQKFRGIDAATRVLVLANRTTDSTQLHQQLLARHAGGPITVTVLAPANWEVQNPDEGTEPARSWPLVTERNCCSPERAARSTSDRSVAAIRHASSLCGR